MTGEGVGLGGVRVDLAELKRLAGEATPGPWGAGGRGVGTDYRDGRDEVVVADCHVRVDTAQREHGDWLGEMRAGSRDADFIAAANPAVVVALVERVEAAEAAVASVLRETADFIRDTSGIGMRGNSYADGWYAALEYALGEMYDRADRQQSDQEASA